MNRRFTRFSKTFGDAHTHTDPWVTTDPRVTTDPWVSTFLRLENANPYSAIEKKLLDLFGQVGRVACGHDLAQTRVGNQFCAFHTWRISNIKCGSIAVARDRIENRIRFGVKT